MNGYTVFEGVHFGTPENPTRASFYNAQFLGETHFERTTWNAVADFTTMFGAEIAFNEAHFNGPFILDDAYVQGRVALTDATFDDDALWSWYGADIASFQVDPSHIDRAGDPPHRLFYEHCALGHIDRADPRIARMDAADDTTLRMDCYDRVIDEFVALKDTFGDAAMVEQEDEAYWWFRHHKAMKKFRFGDPFEKASAALLSFALFEICFGWGFDSGTSVWPCS